jgi:predicted phage terminase large subunit-like protein
MRRFGQAARLPNSELHQLRTMIDQFTKMAAAQPHLLKQASGRFRNFVTNFWDVLHPGKQFVGGWVPDAICEHLEAITRGDITRLLINVPPGFAKSMLTNVFWPAWEWGPKGMSSQKYISASYGMNLAVRDMRFCRDLIKSEQYQQLWPLKFAEDQDLKENYALTTTGWRKATSIGSDLTGWRGTRIIVDDPHSVKTAESDAHRAEARFWFTETTPTRFEDQEHPVYVVIMQRLHEEDISGIIIEQLVEQEGWTHLCIPMEYEPKFVSYTPVPNKEREPERVKRVKEPGEPVPYFVPDPNGQQLYRHDPRTEDGELAWPERFSRKAVEELKVRFRSNGGSYAEACQLQQRPVPRGGGIFPKDAFIIVNEAPKCVKTVRGWDLAATASSDAAYTVGLKMGKLPGTGWVILDVCRLQGTPGAVEQAIRECAERDGHNCSISIPQDPGQAGKAQKAHLAQMLAGYDVSFTPETGSKVDRARPLASQVEAGNIQIVRAPWNDAFLAEAGLFPNGKFLDQIDAASRAFSHLYTHHDTTEGISLVAGELIT